MKFVSYYCILALGVSRYYVLITIHLMERHRCWTTKTPFTSCGLLDSKVTTDITVNLRNKTYYHCSIIVTAYAYIHAK